MTPLTPRQKQVLDLIEERTRRNGYAPSQQEIARALGMSSLGTVQHHLRALEREGLLTREWNARRGVKLTEVGPARPWRGAALPLSGTVAAGRPIEAVETPDLFEVPSSMAGDGRNFVLRVKGDSMIGDGILDGDFVVVRKQETAENGQTVVALLGNEATVKRLQIRGGRVELHPANPALSPLVVEEGQPFRIEGVVVGVIRNLA